MICPGPHDPSQQACPYKTYALHFTWSSEVYYIFKGIKLVGVVPTKCPSEDKVLNNTALRLVVAWQIFMDHFYHQHDMILRKYTRVWILCPENIYSLAVLVTHSHALSICEFVFGSILPNFQKFWGNSLRNQVCSLVVLSYLLSSFVCLSLFHYH